MSNTIKGADERGLLPCPICGGKASDVKPITQKVWGVKCNEGLVSHSCSAMSWTSADHCAEEWNRRASLGAAQVPARQVAFPETDDEAAAMVALGTDWLKKREPHRLSNLAGDTPHGDPNDELRRQAGFRDQGLWDRGYKQGYADGESSAVAAQVPSLTFEEWAEQPVPGHPQFKRNKVLSPRVLKDIQCGWNAALAALSQQGDAS